MRWEYIDELAALVLIIGCIVLIASHIDGEVKAAMTLAVGYMIGTGYQGRKKGKGG